MHLRRWFLLLAISQLLWLPLSGQQRTPPEQSASPIQRDPNAVVVIQNALRSMGGEALIGKVQGVTSRGSTINSPDAKPAYIVARERGQAPTAADSATGSAPSVWVPLPPESVAATLLNLFRSGFSLKYLGSVGSGQNAPLVVKFTAALPSNLMPLPAPSLQTWYFNPQTGLPVRVEYPQTNADPGLIILQSVDFSDYRPVSGVLFPHHMVMHRSDQQDQVVNLQTVTPVLSTN
jgi:hypothetical protein